LEDQQQHLLVMMMNLPMVGAEAQAVEEVAESKILQMQMLKVFQIWILEHRWTDKMWHCNYLLI
jgi:hypothetical protein